MANAAVTRINVQFVLDGTMHDVNLDPEKVSAIVFRQKRFNEIADLFGRSHDAFNPADGFPTEAGLIGSPSAEPVSAPFTGGQPLWWFSEELGMWIHP